MMVRKVGADQDIVRDGDRPSQSCLLLEGMLFRYKLAGEDRRQILAFHIAGEIPDLQSLYIKTMDHSLAAVTDSKVGFISTKRSTGWWLSSRASQVRSGARR
jgi:CRP-like cAMP-binding protein